MSKKYYITINRKKGGANVCAAFRNIAEIKGRALCGPRKGVIL